MTEVSNKKTGTAREVLAIALKAMRSEAEVARALQTPAIALAEDLGFDSLDIAELSARVEDASGIDPFTNGPCRTIADVISALEKGRTHV